MIDHWNEQPQFFFEKIIKQGVCHNVAFPFTLKSILRQKKNYECSNIFTMQKYNLQKNPLKETKILQDITTLELISSFQHKPKFHLSKILILKKWTYHYY